MFKTIVSKMDRDNDYPARQFTLDVYTRVLDGAFYDHLSHGFHEEQNGAGEYVPLRDRRPSARTNLCRTVVDDSVALLFSEGHFPTPTCEDREVKQGLVNLIKQTGLNQVMLEAATIGGAGSAAVHMRVLKQTERAVKYRAFFEPHSTEFLTPTFDPANPDRLLKLSEAYKVKGSELSASYGLTAEQRAETYWFRREWDDTAEIWFLPQSISDAKEGKPPVEDPKRTVTHSLGFVPWVWIKNLPGKLRLIGGEGPRAYSDVDGACTIAAAVDTVIEIDYLLSQVGRGLKYSMDPTLLIKEPPGATADDDEEGIVKGAANALRVDADGDAKMLEIGGEAFKVVLEYIRAARELALEAVHGNRADPQKMAAAQSGKAMEIMNLALIWLADRLRVSYGEKALLQLLRMTLKANAKFELTVGDKTWGQLDPDEEITLNWPSYYPSTASDRSSSAGTVTTLTGASLMSRKTAVEAIAADYDIEDVDAELTEIEADQKAAMELAVEEAALVQIKQTAPAA